MTRLIFDRGGMKTFDHRDARLGKFVGLFLEERGLKAEFTSKLLAGDGSRRVFWRITPSDSPVTYVVVESAPLDELSGRENRAYLMIGRHLFKKGLPVPEIYRVDMEKGWFVMEDLGDVNLQQGALRPEDRISLYQDAVKTLFRLQIEGARGFDPSWTCQTERYDAFVMRRYEADYFREAFLRNYLGLKKEWPELELPFIYLAEKASLVENHFFLHRDFQSRNIMVMKDRIGVLDWQGGRLGPLAYDLASLLIDPYTRLSEEEKRRVYRRYMELMEEAFPEKVESFNRCFPYLALQRNLQILGAFSFLSQVRRKTHFRAYIAPALITLRHLLVELKDEELSPLRDLAVSLEDAPTETSYDQEPAR